MSVDTERKRRSVNQLPPLTILPTVNSAVDSQDRMVVSFLYGGIAPAIPVQGFTDTVAFDLFIDQASAIDLQIKDIHLNNEQTRFEFTVQDGGSTLSLAEANTSTSRVLIFEKPTGSVSSHTASFVSGSGTSGVIAFTSTSGFFDTVGIWSVQARIGLSSSTQTFYTDIKKFGVFENLE